MESIPAPIDRMSTVPSQTDDTILRLTRGLTIRRWRHSDAPLAAQLCNNDKLWINMRDTFPRPYTVDAAHAYIAGCKSAGADSTLPLGPDVDAPAATRVPNRYAICLDDSLIGGCGLKQSPDVARRGGELGYWLGEPYWGRGYATEVVRAFVDWAFENCAWLLRVEAYVFTWNDRWSGNVLRKCGFVAFGRLRAAVWKDGKVTSVVGYEKVREGVVAVDENPLIR